jgi:hypothetical protein
MQILPVRRYRRATSCHQSLETQLLCNFEAGLLNSAFLWHLDPAHRMDSKSACPKSHIVLAMSMNSIPMRMESLIHIRAFDRLQGRVGAGHCYMLNDHGIDNRLESAGGFRPGSLNQEQELIEFVLVAMSGSGRCHVVALLQRKNSQRHRRRSNTVLSPPSLRRHWSEVEQRV